MRIIGIIPARMASSRFPGKPMALIHGMPMIGHCYLRSKLCKLLTDCYVATPDKEIYDYISSIDGKAIMTSHKHIMCNDRVVEAVNKIEKNNKIKYDIIVNIQGDLPMIFPDMIDNLIKPLIMNQNIECSTMADPVLNEKEFNDPNRVKVIFDLNKNAILFIIQVCTTIMVETVLTGLISEQLGLRPMPMMAMCCRIPISWKLFI